MIKKKKRKRKTKKKKVENLERCWYSHDAMTQTWWNNKFSDLGTRRTYLKSKEKKNSKNIQKIRTHPSMHKINIFVWSIRSSKTDSSRKIRKPKYIALHQKGYYFPINTCVLLQYWTFSSLCKLNLIKIYKEKIYGGLNLLTQKIPYLQPTGYDALTYLGESMEIFFEAPTCPHFLHHCQYTLFFIFFPMGIFQLP